MTPGRIVDRFEIEREAGRGGMGTVFRAFDRESQRVVALKIVEPALANARFEREAELLATLDDPAIVRYVAHGKLEAGRMFLAMEWLEGEPLDARLANGALGIEDTLAVGRRLARALATAHERGIVHRDVKPANVMLRGGRPEEATLVDFGIARVGGKTHAMTATGTVIGTPAYMAPEQARGQSVHTPADVFSLACVLFECLTGRPAFVGEHVIAVLAKILLEAAPRVRSIRSDVPAALDALVARMLEKEIAARPPDGKAVLAALAGLSASVHAGTGDTGPEAASTRAAVGTAEARLATVLLARRIDESIEQADTEEALAGLTSEEVLGEAAGRYGVPLTMLANGTLVGVVVAQGGASDAGERAARCALAMRAAMGDVTIALSTGRTVVDGPAPVGTAIDEAARLLTRRTSTSGIWIDETTASIVEHRFELSRVDGAIAIVAERAVAEFVRSAGRGTPFVGREREMAILELTLRECIDEPTAHAHLVIGEPGLGKSRLRREFVTRATRDETTPSVWLALADPLMQDAPFALAGDLLRRHLGFLENEPLEKRRAQIRARAGDETTAKFLGEIAGAPFDDDDDPVLRAARRSPSLFGTHVTDALVSLARRELTRAPVLVVLEDLHWADAPSVALFGALLARLRDRPLMLLGLARPNVDDVHPKLWSDMRCQRIDLKPLLKKASTKLARALVGESADVEALVARADGNALFVEELARAFAQHGAPSELPPTVAAAAEARLATFDPAARAVLRAGAVFGERFWLGGVASMVSPEVVASLDTIATTLERLEVVTRSSDSRFADEIELVFRHALVRDAAYAMLPEDDRKLAHARAAEWLESRVDDSVLLAHHFEQGDRDAEAARWHVRAAEDAFAANDFQAALRHVGRAETLGASGSLLGSAQLTAAQAHFWLVANADAHARGLRALDLLDRASADWFTALGLAAAAAGKLGNAAEVLALAARLDAVPAADEAAGRMRAIARARAAMQLLYVGEPARARELLEGCDREPGAAGDPAVEAWLVDAEFERTFATGDPVPVALMLRGRDRYMQIGDVRSALLMRANYCLMLAGAGVKDEALAEAEALGAGHSGDVAQLLAYARMLILAQRAAEEGDFGPFRNVADVAKRRSERVGVANTLWLALFLFEGGRIDEAAAENEALLEMSVRAPPFHTVSLALAARIALRRGDMPAAERFSDRAAAAAARGTAYWGKSATELSRIEVLEAVGRNDEARAAFEEAMDAFRRRADAMDTYRTTFLHSFCGNRALLALATARGVSLL